uniref:Protein kinase domain-containing protein n=1 Tax=Denticeps clupeoides TaxID=299321 RepID=A0AAY4D1Q4_9TELE
MRYPYEDYKILKCIEEGAFGKVHKARNLKTGHLVAIKIQDCTNDNFMDLYEECKLLESFNHQNIPKVMDKYYWEQKFYICMELCAGGDLTDIYMGTGSLKESQVAFVAKEVLETLLYLHQKGYVHRDIKPNNILLTDAGEVRLVDFGSMSSIQTEKPTFIDGTPAYLAPEYVLEDLNGDYDERCDVWSLGMTLLELAEGRLPLLLTSSYSYCKYWQQKNRVPQLRKRDKWSPAFHSFLEDALTLDPAMRPSVEKLLQHEFLSNVEHEPSPLKRRLRRTKFLRRIRKFFNYGKLGVLPVVCVFDSVSRRKQTEAAAAVRPILKYVVIVVFWCYSGPVPYIGQPN